MNGNIPAGPRYESTRHAWEDIWQHASVENELQTNQYARAKDTFARFIPYLSKTDLILEAGSGLSAALITLRRIGYNVIGLDYAINALRVSRHYDPGLPLLAGDVHALPHADNSLGAYLSFGVLEHFEHGMGPALAEAYRVLKPGGVLVLTIPYPNLVYRLIQWRRRRQGIATLTDNDFYESAYTHEQLRQVIVATGFEPLSLQPTGHAFTLWGLGAPFRGKGYYQTSPLAETLGKVLRLVLPWAFNFTTLVVAKKP